MIVGDWGTSRLRVFRLEDGRVVDRLHGPGVGALTTSPAETLLDALRPWAADAFGSTVTLCGMAGSTLGLVSAPYLPCPASLADLSRKATTLQVGDVLVRIVSGLSCENFSGAPDVLRGEETQMLGALRLDPSLAAGPRLLVLPGTHSKWARLEAGRVERFHTFLTGELFAHLRLGTTLITGNRDAKGDPDGFQAGLELAGKAEPLASLFTARAAQLVQDKTPSWAVGFISGLLIGGETREALRLAGGTPGEVVVIGEPALWDLYREALERLGVQAARLDGDDCVLAGLHEITSAHERAC